METLIQIISPGSLDEFNELISVFETVFEMDPPRRASQKHLENLLKRKDFFAVTAKSENKVVAGLTFYVLEQYYSEKPLAYLYDLAVLPSYQRKGIGRKLIEFTTSYCRQNGFEEVFVQADKVDDYALHFYRATKPTNEEQVVHFYYTLADNL